MYFCVAWIREMIQACFLRNQRRIRWNIWIDYSVTDYPVEKRIPASSQLVSKGKPISCHSSVFLIIFPVQSVVRILVHQDMWFEPTPGNKGEIEINQSPHLWRYLIAVWVVPALLLPTTQTAKQSKMAQAFSVSVRKRENHCFLFFLHSCIRGNFISRVSPYHLYSFVLHSCIRGNFISRECANVFCRFGHLSSIILMARIFYFYSCFIRAFVATLSAANAQMVLFALHFCIRGCFFLVT